MQIGDLARTSGLTASRIRFYESAGLIPRADRRPNGYRHYPAETVRALEIIACAQKAGFTLEEIRRLTPSAGPHPDRKDELIAALRRKVDEIGEMQAQLDLNRTRLLAVIAAIEADLESHDCATGAERAMAAARG